MNPYSRYNVTCGWTCHTSRKPPSPGGIDRGMPKGTALVVPPGYDGVVSFTPLNGSLGHTVTIRLDRPDANGAVKIQFAHCSQFVGANGRHVTGGEVVARSGGVKGEAGSGMSTGPHLHAHGINAAGKRVPPAYETSSSTAGGGGTTPIIEGNENMTMVIWDGQNPAGGQARWAVVGQSPGTTANCITTKEKAKAERWAAALGVGIFDCGSAAEFDAYCSWFQQPVKSTAVVNVGDVTLDTTAIVEALVALGVKIDALPQTIDEYADGKRQS